MLKAADPVKVIEQRAAVLLEELLRRIPSLTVKSVAVEEPFGKDKGIDILARVRSGEQDYFLICEVKQNGQPRFARQAIDQMKAYLSRSKHEAIPIFIAPFLTTATQELCRSEGVGYLDLEGNAHIAFGSVYIERATASRPEVEKRELRSLFKPRSAQVLRVLLRDPKRLWKLSELADQSGVSIGHVSNVRNALADREWVEVRSAGIQLTSPRALLNAWRESYQIEAVQELKFYTTLHGKTWERSIRDFFESHPSEPVALASFSSAQWIAPYGRTSTHFFYADREATLDLKTALALSKPTMGENVIVWIPSNDGVFTDSFEVDGGIRCTSPLQTYLDLSQAGDRGLEAADHLRKAKLAWQK
jgi:Transcriptional regulator, AbiEi antitoxin, Type IV TA system